MEKFDVRARLKASLDENGKEIMEPAEENGLPVHALGSDGKMHRVFSVKRYLPANAYREWFYKEYPEGAIVPEDLTLPMVYDQGRFIESPEVRFMVTLYEDREQKKIISRGFGCFRRSGAYDPEKETMYIDKEDRMNGFLIAQAMALKCAMNNAGFVYFPEADEENRFSEQVLEDDASSFVPLTPAGGKGTLEGAENAEDPKAEPLPGQITMKLAGPEAEERGGESGKSIITGYDDPVLAFLEKKGSGEQKEISPEETVFSVLEGADVSEKIRSLEGKTLKELDRRLISYFSKKDMRPFLKEETINAILKMA